MTGPWIGFIGLRNHDLAVSSGVQQGAWLDISWNIYGRIDSAETFYEYRYFTGCLQCATFIIVSWPRFSLPSPY